MRETLALPGFDDLAVGNSCAYHTFRPPRLGRFHKGMRPPYQHIAGNVTTKQAPPPDGDSWRTVAP
jgi:hypothetical protein